MRNPFHEGVGAVPYDKFGGRDDICGVYSDALQGTSPFFWIVQGRESLGKSSLAQWCANAAHDSNQKEHVRRALVGYVRTGKLPEPVDRGVFLSAILNDVVERKVQRSGRIRRMVRQCRKGLGWVGRRIGSIQVFTFQFIKATESAVPTPQHLLKRLWRLAGDRPVVIIIDEIDESVRPWALQYAVDLVMNFEAELSTDAAGAGKTRAPVNVVLLLFPGTSVDDLPKGLGRRVKWFALGNFSPDQAIAYIHARCGAEEVDVGTDFAATLTILSGGIPYLLQQIGYAAYVEMQRGGEARLTGQMARDALASDRVRDAIEYVLRNVYHVDVERPREPGETAVFARFFWIAPGIDTTPEMTRSGWWNLMVPKLTKAAEPVFDRVWSELVTAGILVPQPGTKKYRFVAEAIRRSLGKLQ